MSNNTNKKSPSAQMKEKVHLVREGIKELFPDKSKQISNDHIHIILENYNCNVKSTVEAFCDGQADSLLTEWKKAGPKTSKASKKKKRKANKKAAEQAALNAKLNKEAANPGEVKAENPAAVPQEQPPVEEKEANLTFSPPVVEDGNSTTTPSSIVEAFPMSSEAPVTTSVASSPKPTLHTAEGAKKSIVTMVNDGPLSDKYQGDVKKPKIREPTSSSVAADVPIVSGSVSTNISKDDTAVSLADVDKPKEKLSPEKSEQPVVSSTKDTTTSAVSQSPKKKPSAAKPPSGKAVAPANSVDKNVPAPVAAQPPTKSSTENDSAAARENKKAIEKGSRDLHRCAVSLKHYQAKVVEESDQSVRDIQAAFKIMYTLLEDREVELMRKSDARRDYAKEFLSRRQAEGQRLKVCTDRVGQMSSAEVNDLRAKIKHFVSERKHDELMARTARIVSPSVDEFKNFLQRLGEENAVKRPTATTETSAADGQLSTTSTTTVSKSFIATPDTPATPIPPSTAKTPVADDVFVDSQPPPSATTSSLNDDHGANDKHQTDNNNNNDPPVHVLPVSPQKRRSPRSHHGRPRNLSIKDGNGEKVHENGNSSDWADDAPMPPSPASWASEGGADHHHNSLLSHNNDDHANSRGHESRRSSSKNHYNNHRKHSSNKQHQQDSEQMPPPKSTELMHRSSHRSNNNNAAPTRDRSHSNSRSRGRVGPPPHHHQQQGGGGHYHHNRANSNGPASGDAPDYHQHHQPPQRNGSYRGGRPDGRYQQQGRSRNNSYRGRGGGGQNRSNGGGSGGSYSNRRGSYNSSTGTFYRGTNGGGVGSDQQQRRRNYSSTNRQYDSSKSKAQGSATAEAVTAHD